MIDWMPGQEPILDDRQIRQAFHDGMPQAWRNRFSDAGNSPAITTLSETLKYFCQQERQSALKARENTKKQRSDDRSGQPSRSALRSSRRSRLQKRKTPETDKNYKKQNSRISDDAECPIHIGSGHTWGNCRANAFSQSKKRKTGDDKPKPTANLAKPGSKAQDGFIATTDTSDKDVGSEPSQDEEKLTSADEMSISSVVNNALSDMDCKSLSTWFSDSDTNNLLYTHAIDLFDPLLAENALGSPSDLLDIRNYMAEMNHLYLAGSTDELRDTINLETQVSLRLRPTTLALVKNIQGCKSNRPLKVLFDTGSETTLLSKNALPKGCVPKHTKPLNLRGIGQTQTRLKVHLEKMRLPEFSPTQCIDKAIAAYVVPDFGIYDLILGTDVMIPLEESTNTALQKQCRG
jgi:hypothetical protein